MNLTVTKSISVGHRLPSYKGICSSMHGHNLKVLVTISVTEGFLDFKTISAYLDKVLEPMDHAMILYEGDPIGPLLETMPGQRTFFLSHEPTTECIAQYIFNVMHDAYNVECVTVNETDRYSAQAYKFSNEVFRVSEAG